VFVDESGIGEHPQREFGRAPRGEAVTGTKPGKRPGRINVIGALCVAMHLCMECYRHATTAEFFEHWFETRLFEAIPWGEGYTVILDNAGFRRKKALRKLARAAVPSSVLAGLQQDREDLGEHETLFAWQLGQMRLGRIEPILLRA